MGVLSATAPVIAILGEHLYRGQAVGYMSGTGRITMRAATKPGVSCNGDFRYTGSRAGNGSVQCSDGISAVFQFQALDSLSGHGFGHSSEGGFSFTFGLTPAQSMRYLVPPPAKRIERHEESDDLLLIET